MAGSLPTWTKKHVLINEKMIIDGYAILFTIEPNTKYPTDSAKQRAERAKDREAFGARRD